MWLVDADSGEVTIHKSGTAVITATEQRTTATTPPHRSQSLLPGRYRAALVCGLADCKDVRRRFVYRHGHGRTERGAVTYKASGRGVVSVNSATGLVAIQMRVRLLLPPPGGDDRYNGDAKDHDHCGQSANR